MMNTFYISFSIISPDEGIPIEDLNHIIEKSSELAKERMTSFDIKDALSRAGLFRGQGVHEISWVSPAVQGGEWARFSINSVSQSAPHIDLAEAVDDLRPNIHDKILRRLLLSSVSSRSKLYLRVRLVNGDGEECFSHSEELRMRKKSNRKSVLDISADKIKTAIAISTFASLTMACGTNGNIFTQNRSSLPKIHDPFFDSYIEKIELDYAKLGKIVDINVPISFGSLPSSQMAVCNFTNKAEREIIINSDAEAHFRGEHKTNGKEQTKAERAELDRKLDQILKHEIGHCFFQRPHDTTLILENDDYRVIEGENFKNKFNKNDRIGMVKAYVPASVMYPYLIEVSRYSKMKSTYDQEMIEPGFRSQKVIEENSQTNWSNGDSTSLPINSLIEMTVYVINDINGKTVYKTTSYNDFIANMKNQVVISNMEDTESLNLASKTLSCDDDRFDEGGEHYHGDSD